MSGARVRRAAARLIDQALAARSPVDEAVRRAQAGLDRRDAALLRELVSGTLRWLARLDHVIAIASARPVRRIEPRLLAPLRIAVYQLLWMDRVPAYAAVSEAVDEARRRGSRRGAGFVNGVLRAIAAKGTLGAWPVEIVDPVARLAVESSHPELLVRRWLEHFGERRTRRLLAANNRPASLTLLAFRDRGGREGLARRLASEGVETEPAALSPLGLVVRGGDVLGSAALAEGDAYVQDPASQAAAWIPPPARGERVLDVAAAPGGKSFATLAWQPGARIWATDVALRRAVVLRENAHRLSRPIPLLVADATRPALGDRLPFDRVVVDLPCSGTGTLRRHPELKWRISETELDRLAGQGAAMLRGAAEHVAPGGLLVVSTCSLEPEENERLVAGLLAEQPSFEPLALEGELPAELAAGVVAAGRWQVLTGDEHDGFTVHALRRS